ncbi:p53-induced death domain-containing protein 1 isoform X1 [Megalops cyprinoides]|uniref:p53-induced death domain-containing protein 1 isoform X1 n=1 Tax=Megalops cyprinoides TaxID=118141 RepID=UPI001863DB17|nr:p53-induced death domain-containing protein 1 isoform X1 [Megalops cyprinoides]XP_036390637.1 p53-induced death domain-containing protein 1 isoform X1 [Megalops cyprinoides]
MDEKREKRRGRGMGEERRLVKVKDGHRDLAMRASLVPVGTTEAMEWNRETEMNDEKSEGKETSKGEEKKGEHKSLTRKESKDNEDESKPASSLLSVSPSLDTWTPTPLTSSSPSPPWHLPPLSISSSLSSPLPLTQPVELCAVLCDNQLTLDVYLGGAAMLPVLLESVPEQVRKVKYLRLGSEDSDGLERALAILPHFTLLRSLAIRGHCLQDPRGNALPGLLSSLPPSLSSLSLLTHLDFSFNQLSSLPSCLLSLPHLSTLLLSHNLLSTLPSSLGCLHSLTYLTLMGNRLQSIPPCLGELRALQTLDLSYNLLEAVPKEAGLLEGLRTLELSHNRLRELPDTMGSLLSLRELVIHSNNLHSVPECVKNLPHLVRLDTRNNPLGWPLTPLPPAPALPAQTETELPELHIGPNQHCFYVSAAGCHVFLPGGAELLFPQGCMVSTVTLKWAERRPDRKWIWLEEHDFLLSRPLELLPHGTAFLKPIEICVPYRKARRGEVVVRRFDGESWSTLPTTTRRGSQRHSVRPVGRPARLACCSVSQFSWFVVVSRLVRDTCSVPSEGALLVSSVDPAIKLMFPQGCTQQTRTIILQVLQVALSEVQELSGDSQASASSLLCLSQEPSIPFLRPVRVQMPLPPGLTGHTMDVSCLYLLHGDPVAHTWTDVTPQASLQITHLYAVFTITHFSWYWLWYTTQRCVSGVVRKVYERLRQFRVQFLVLQRRTDPMQVLLQCLPTNKVESTVCSLSTQYDGPQPSDVCELLEGEQFFAGFERGIDINTDRPDCIEGRLSFVFYSHLKNHKEIYICPSPGQEEPVRGQVSFYRGEVPSDIPQEVTQKRKGPDTQWLATLPLKLPLSGWIWTRAAHQSAMEQEWNCRGNAPSGPGDLYTTVMYRSEGREMDTAWNSNKQGSFRLPYLDVKYSYLPNRELFPLLPSKQPEFIVAWNQQDIECAGHGFWSTLTPVLPIAVATWLVVDVSTTNSLFHFIPQMFKWIDIW